MGIRETHYFTVHCDGCKTTFVDAAFSRREFEDEDAARAKARKYGWVVEPDGECGEVAWCPRCTQDDDPNDLSRDPNYMLQGWSWPVGTNGTDG